MDGRETARMLRSALERSDRQSARSLMHPRLHWRRDDGRAVHGRNRVLAMLEHHGVPEDPASIEMREGRIYRWRG